MPKRSHSFQELFLRSLDEAGETALKVGQSIADNKRLQADESRRQESHDFDMGKKKREFGNLLEEDSLIKSMEARGALTPRAQAGTPTADGHAVNFDEIKAARKFDDDANLFNSLNRGRPDFNAMTGEQMRKKEEQRVMKRDRAEQAEIVEGERETIRFNSDIQNKNAGTVAKLAGANKVKPPAPDMAAIRGEQNRETNVRNSRRDFEDNDFIKMIPKTDRYFTSAEKAWDNYKAAKPEEKEAARQFTDQALVYSFNKLMEETSAVMPGEFERTAMGQSIASDFTNKIRQGLGGGLKLDDTQRQAMINTMRIFRDNVIENARPVYKQYQGEAGRVSPNAPDRVLGSYTHYFENGASPGGQAGSEVPKSKGRTYPEQVRSRALQALEDPEASADEKAAAKRILMGQ